jgi:hypothetical protein
MLKPIFLAATTILTVAFVSINRLQVANATTKPTISPIGLQQLIAKGTKANQQQIDVKNIRQVLTQFYRGINEYDVESMAQVFVVVSPREKAYMQKLFDRLKSDRLDLSVEVKSIELLQLSDRNAVVKVELNMIAANKRELGRSSQSSTLALVKYKNQWKISDVGNSRS